MKKLTLVLVLLAALLLSSCVAYDYAYVAPVPARATVVYYPSGYYYSRPYYRPTPPPPPPRHHRHHHYR